MEWIYVAAGGAIGSAVRYGLSQAIHERIETGFPLGTLLINWAGCLLIGLIIGLLERGEWLQSPVRLFLVVGLLGGFTTFSSFSLESIGLLRQNLYTQAAAYMSLSLIVGLLLTWGGFLLSRIR